MGRQLTYSDFEYSNRKRQTKREAFLEQMNAVIPWAALIALIVPFYPSGGRGRPTKGIETMLRMYLLQDWFNLSGEMTEDSIYDSYAMRSFMNINFLEEQAPDATTLLKFRHLIEEHKLGEAMFNEVNRELEAAGCMWHGGTIVDATIIESTKSTKNRSGERDPEMHQTKKGNQWYHGMKGHICVDAGTGYVHTVTATAANVSDIDETVNLIREDDEVLYGDAAYVGVDKRDEIIDNPDLSLQRIKVSGRRGKNRDIPEGYAKQIEMAREYLKSKVRCKVKHPFHIIKDKFGYRKTVYRGLAKNLNRLHMLFMSANLLMCAQSGGFEAHAQLWA